MARSMHMTQTIHNRVLHEANYYLEHSTTLREMEKEFGWARTTIHMDLSVRLKTINPELWEKCQKILHMNFTDAPYRGGVATHTKYKESSNT